MFGPSLQYFGRAQIEELGRELREAAKNGMKEEVIALLDQGADIEATDEVRHVILLL